MGTIIDSEPHPASWLALTRTEDYSKIMREISQIYPGSEQSDSFYNEITDLVRKEISYLGYAMRFHNMNFPDDKVILQDIMLDFAGSVRDHGKGRSAAQNHLMCVVLLATRLEMMKNKAREHFNTYWKDFMTAEERQQAEAAREGQSQREGPRIQPKKMPRQP
eukprot:s7306_g1.t1